MPTRVHPGEIAKLVKGGIVPRDEVIKGISINGSEFSGPAILCKNRQNLARVVPGQIIVTRHATPDLVSMFNSAAGIITETGGLLSHLAIVSREHGFPLVLQAHNATTLIKEGEPLKALSDGTVLRA